MTSHNDVSKRLIRVIVIDDHPAICDALQEAFSKQKDFEFAGRAYSAEQAMELVETKRPDAAVLDISLGTEHGLDLIHILKFMHGEIHVIVFSMFAEEVYAERAIKAGASGYVMKNQPSSSVVEAVRNAVEGEIVLSHRIASRIISKIVRKGSQSAGFAIDDFTDREMAVFQLLGQGVPVDVIADQLHLSRKTVETYRRRAKEKLGFESVSELLRYAVQWSHGHLNTN